MTQAHQAEKIESPADKPKWHPPPLAGETALVRTEDEGIQPHGAPQPWMPLAASSDDSAWAGDQLARHRFLTPLFLLEGGVMARLGPPCRAGV